MKAFGGGNRKRGDFFSFKFTAAWMKALGRNGYDGVFLNRVKALTFSTGKGPAEGNPGCCLETRKRWCEWWTCYIFSSLAENGNVWRKKRAHFPPHPQRIHGRISAHHYHVSVRHLWTFNPDGPSSGQRSAKIDCGTFIKTGKSPFSAFF